MFNFNISNLRIQLFLRYIFLNQKKFMNSILNFK